VLVYFQRYARSRKYYPTEDELRRGLGLHPLMRRGQEAVYDYVAGPASSPSTARTADDPPTDGNGPPATSAPVVPGEDD
jgi:hypothetical protein